MRAATESLRRAASRLSGRSAITLAVVSLALACGSPPGDPAPAEADPSRGTDSRTGRVKDSRTSRATDSRTGRATGSGVAPGTADAPGAARLGEPVTLASPAGPEAGEPNLHVGSDGSVHLSWIEAAEAGHALRFAVLDPRATDGGWSAPRTIAESDGFFVNWADFPSLVALEDGTLVAHWLQREGPGYAYGVRLSRSTDGGTTWSEPVTPHHDGTLTEHGFVSLVREPGGGFTAVWLDGRDFADAEPTAGGHGAPDGEMSLRASTFAADGTQGPVHLLDSRICDCCQTSAARVGEELLVVYRDRSPEEIRDIWAVTRGPDGWREPVRLARDDWQIPGCPVNGPSVASRGGRAAVAWFSLRQGRPEVKLAFTEDAGGTFSDPILIHGVAGTGADPAAADASGEATTPTEGGTAASDGSSAGRGPGARADDGFVPLGRVDVAWLDDHTVAVSWLVGDGGDGEVRALPVDLDGATGEPALIATTRSDRSSGFPRIVAAGERLVVAWTEPGNGEQPARVRTTTLPILVGPTTR